MSPSTVLIVEDEPDIAELVEYNLQREGYKVLKAADGRKGLELARTRKPDAVILDLMLPEMDGIEVCRNLRQDQTTQDLAVIMLTAKGEESDVVLGLELGADDYMTKPFSPRELVARLRAVLRTRTPTQANGVKQRIQVGSVVLDLERYEIRVDDRNVPVTRAEFRLLWALASRPGRVFTRDELVESITNGENIILGRNVDVHVSSARKKLGPEGDMIVTVRGVGYKCRD